MSSIRRDLLLGALGTLLLGCLLRAETPTESRYNRTDSRSSPTMEMIPPIPREIGGKTYDQWKADLEHADPSVRATAIGVIPQFREKAEDAVPILLKRMNDQDASPRVKAVLAIKVMGIRGTDRERVVEALGTRISHDTQAIVRYEAAQAIMRFGEDGRKVVGDLVRGVNDTSTWELREACIMALIVAGVDEKKGPDPRVTDALILRTKVFTEPTAKVRLEAIIALGAMGRPQDPAKLKQVYGALEDHFRSTNFAVQLWAHVSKMALEDQVDKEYLKKIARHLKDNDRETKIQAVSALGALKDKAEVHLPEVLDMMRFEKDLPVLVAGCRALGQMGNHGSRVLQALIRQTEREKSEEVEVVIAACNALAQLGSPTPEVMEALNKVLEHKSLSNQSKDGVRKAIELVQKPKDSDAKPKGRLKGGVTGGKR